MSYLLLTFCALLASCSAIKVDGDCSYERAVTVTYVCQPDGKLEHYRLAPVAPE
jgi:hypothetical protein